MKFGPIEISPDVARTRSLQKRVVARNHGVLSYEPDAFERWVLDGYEGLETNPAFESVRSIVAVLDELGLQLDGYSEVDLLDPASNGEQCCLLSYLALGEVIDDGTARGDSGFEGAGFNMHVRSEISGPNNVGDLLPPEWVDHAYSIDVSVLVLSSGVDNLR